MNINDFNFTLPEELIARYPLDNRSDSRLLVGNPHDDSLIDSNFKHLADFLNPGDLLVFNDSKVIPARLYAQKPSGGKVEILIERMMGQYQALAHLGSNKALKISQQLVLADDSTAEIIGRQDRLFILQFGQDQLLLDRLEKIGHMPLPPYLKREDEPQDLTRYQTVYAQHQGSVAAPTAGLHFDQLVLDSLKEKGIESTYLTLHVGAGTFMPVQVNDINQHVMHHEWISISETTCEKIRATKQRGNKVIAVGTTSLRCLESAAINGVLAAYTGETNIFILPGFHFQIADGLITNFHFPESTLLILIAAFVGLDFCKKMYAHAVQQKYRFYSYGDSSFILRKSL